MYKIIEEESKALIDGLCNRLMSRKEVPCIIRIENKEQAVQLYKWLYGMDKHMLSTLVEFSWDAKLVEVGENLTLVPTKEAELFAKFKELLLSD